MAGPGWWSPFRAEAVALLSVAALAFVLLTPSAAAAQETGCDAAVGESVAWDVETEVRGVVVRGSGVSLALAERVANAIDPWVARAADELAPLDGAEICLFPNEMPIDAQALGWDPVRVLRAAAFGPEQALFLSTLQASELEPAAVMGVTYLAQWRVDPAYPEPLGTAVRQFYRSGHEGEVDRNRDVMSFAHLTERFDPIPWTEGAIQPVLLWNIESQTSPIGDFAAYVVEQGEQGLFTAPDAERLMALDESWRGFLLDEARGGEATSGWLVGLAFIAGAISLTVGIVVARWWRGRRDSLARR